MAAVTQGQIKLKVEFDIVNSTFKFTDQTTYDDYTTVKGAIKIEYKGVTVWDNLANIDTSPDIDGSSAGQANEALLRSNTTPTPLNLPTTLNGEYTVTYSIKEGVLDPISAAVTFDYTYVAPEGDLDATVDLTLTSPSIKIVDNTNYKVSNITPTGTPTIKMYYPADVDLPEVSEQTSLLTVTNFYTGTQIGVLDADKVWDYTSTVTDTTFTEGYATVFTLDTITDRINIPVESNGDICTIFCCLKDFENRLSLSKSNPTKYQELSDIAGKVGFYFSSILAAFECGKTENVNDWITEIRSLVDCNEDCGCDGSEPILISPINGETVGYNLTINDGTTSVSNVTGVSFSGATLTDDGDGQVTVAITGGGGGSSTFTGLTDTPSTYSGQSGKLTQVNSGETAVEFTSTPVVDSIQLSGGSGTEGTLSWNNTDKTADLNLNNVTLQIGQEEVIRVVNKTGANLLEADFKAVRVRLVSEGGAQGGRLAIVLAQANSDINSATAIGLVTESIDVNQEGFVTISGNVNGIDTTGAKSASGTETWQDGDILYLDPNNAGYLTNVKPVTPGHLVVMGYVAYAHANQGKIFVKVDNGYEIEELHDVLITSVTDNELLQWNATGGYWENQTLAEAGIQPSGNYLTEIKQDTTPQLGGDLDVNNSRIISVSNQDIEIIPDGTGRVTLGNFVFKTSQVPSGTEDNYVLTYDDTAGTIQLEAVSGGGSGTVTSVAATVPTGFTISGSPITTAGTLAIAFDTGYSLPSNTLQSQWSAKLQNLIEDTTPQLGGNLDVNGQIITSAGGGNIQIAPDTGGRLELNGLAYPTTDGTAGQAITTNGAGTLAFTDVGSGTVTSVTGTGTSAGLTLTGSGTSTVTLTLGGTLDISADTTPTLGGALDANNNNISNVNKITAKEFVAANQTITGLGIGSITVDASAGTFVEYTLNENITSFSVNNMVKGEPLTIKINTGVGGYSISGWAKDSAPANFLWSGGTAPTITATASKVDIVTLICDGTNIYASIVQDF